MQKVLSFAPESAGSVGKNALALCGSDLATQVGLAGLAELAFLAFGSTFLLSAGSFLSARLNILKSNNMVARLDVGYALSNGFNDTGTLVS